MTPKEYLQQAHRLEQLIQSMMEEVRQLRLLAVNVSAPVLGDRVTESKNSEAPFCKTLEKLMETEEEMQTTIQQLLSLKEQIRKVIDDLDNPDERVVLRYRYFHQLTWEEIGDRLNVNRSSVKRWHNQAIEKVHLPEDMIKLK